MEEGTRTGKSTTEVTRTNAIEPTLRSKIVLRRKEAKAQKARLRRNQIIRKLLK
jgi:hypothetical protein